MTMLTTLARLKWIIAILLLLIGLVATGLLSLHYSVTTSITSAPFQQFLDAHYPKTYQGEFFSYRIGNPVVSIEGGQVADIDFDLWLKDAFDLEIEERVSLSVSIEFVRHDQQFETFEPLLLGDSFIYPSGLFPPNPFETANLETVQQMRTTDPDAYQEMTQIYRRHFEPVRQAIVAALYESLNKQVFAKPDLSTHVSRAASYQQVENQIEVTMGMFPYAVEDTLRSIRLLAWGGLFLGVLLLPMFSQWHLKPEARQMTPQMTANTDLLQSPRVNSRSSERSAIDRLLLFTCGFIVVGTPVVILLEGQFWDNAIRVSVMPVCALVFWRIWKKGSKSKASNESRED